MENKQGTEVLPAAFTDHHAVVTRIAVGALDRWRGGRRWKMDPVHIREREIKEQIPSKWAEWKTAKRHYPNMTLW
jgi:hypothetical protein